VVGEARALKVLIREVQISPRRHGPVHVDFYRVSLKEKLHADVPVVGVGESPAVKVGLGELHVFSHVLKVECLPADIPEQIDLDLTRLETLDDTLKVSDLVLPAGVTVLADLDEVLAKVAVHKERAADIEDAASEAAAATAASEASAEGESTEDAG
jgi:large subunit ribosomal protein L25